MQTTTNFHKIKKKFISKQNYMCLYYFRKKWVSSRWHTLMYYIYSKVWIVPFANKQTQLKYDIIRRHDNLMWVQTRTAPNIYILYYLNREHIHKTYNIIFSVVVSDFCVHCSSVVLYIIVQTKVFQWHCTYILRKHLAKSQA